LELATTLGNKYQNEQTLKALILCGINPFRVEKHLGQCFPKVVASSNLGLELANAFGVISL
jgi:hypothetical protein